ncbi:MAG: Asp-tRNA(Asn)/Glu-tRNA(Gln) amidotransferase GatCAB subunit C [Alphaproteobacteria bacterium]|nr:Asp-tRNA(Asn)/Glu-tRNA(Gln) amidotransferase GatCAB subunit C [Alphaproteobacteria bacterium]|tara:strand:- start:2631 stop:2918 length:288 start_codon:yes stop_codon:yes gene_type:complete
MSLDKATVSRIARLARIRVADEDLERLGNELSNILGWVEQLNEVNTDDVPPLTSVVEMQIPQRRDAVTDGAYRDKVLGNAPESEEGFFVVPKVVE